MNLFNKVQVVTVNKDSIAVTDERDPENDYTVFYDDIQSHTFYYTSPSKQYNVRLYLNNGKYKNYTINDTRNYDEVIADKTSFFRTLFDAFQSYSKGHPGHIIVPHKWFLNRVIGKHFITIYLIITALIFLSTVLLVPKVGFLILIFALVTLFQILRQKNVSEEIYMAISSVS